jgi:hypothetical protein
MRAAHHPLSAESRRWRAGLLIACALSVIWLFFAFFQCTPLLPWCSTTQGMQTDYTYADPGALVVTSVDKGGPAATVGIRAGDRLKLRPIPFRVRWRLREVEDTGYGGPADQSLRYVVQRVARQFSVLVTPRAIQPTWPWDPIQGGWSNVLGTFGYLWVIGFVALLALRRPDLFETRTLSLILIFAFILNGFTGTLVPFIGIEFFFQATGNILFIAVPVVCLTILASHYARPLSNARKALAALSIAAAICLVCTRTALFVLGWGFGWPVFWLDRGDPSWTFALLASLACAIAAILAARGVERTRLLWIVVSVTPVWLFYSVFSNIVNWISPIYPAVSTFFDALLSFVLFSVPVLLTYAVLSRRCVDIGYVLNRAVVYGAVSVFVLGVFVVVEWALGAWASSASHTTSIVINIALALVLGLSLRAVHRRIEFFTDRVFFRRRHEDEMALRRFAHEAALITEPGVLIDRVEKIVTQHTDADAVEVFLRDDTSSYSIVDGNCPSPSVDENDPAVLAMRTWHEPIDVHRYDTALPGEAAFPMLSRGELLGILVCGPKRDGQSYAPDEHDALAALAHGVGSALGTLRANGQTHAVMYEIRDVLYEVRDALRTFRGTYSE